MGSSLFPFIYLVQLFLKFTTHTVASYFIKSLSQCFHWRHDHIVIDLFLVFFHITKTKQKKKNFIDYLQRFFVNTITRYHALILLFWVFFSSVANASFFFVNID
jgi:hypothetical protein